MIKNLEICHNEWKKYFGGCNQFKIDLNMCLRGEVSSFREFNEREEREGGGGAVGFSASIEIERSSEVVKQPYRSRGVPILL